MFALRRCKRARLDKLASASPARAWSLLLARKHTKLAGTSLVGGIVPAATYDAKVRCFRTGATFQAQGACRLPHVSEGLRQTPCLGPHVRGRSLRAAIRHRRPAHGRSSPIVARCASERARRASCAHSPSPCCGPGRRHRHSGQLVLQVWPPSASAGRSPAVRVCGWAPNVVDRTRLDGASPKRCAFERHRGLALPGAHNAPRLLEMSVPRSFLGPHAKFASP